MIMRKVEIGQTTDQRTEALDIDTDEYAWKAMRLSLDILAIIVKHFF